MLTSYLDQMTGFYLWISCISFLYTVLASTADLSKFSANVSIYIFDDFAIFDGSHLLSLDSLYNMGSLANLGRPIPVHISSFRSSFVGYSNSQHQLNRSSVLTPVQSNHVTNRKPTNLLSSLRDCLKPSEGPRIRSYGEGVMYKHYDT